MKGQPQLKKYNYFFVEDDALGQHGTCIETISLTRDEYKEIKDTRTYNNRRGFITNNYLSALYYMQD